MPIDVKNGFCLGDRYVFPELNRIVINDKRHSVEGKVMAVLVELARQPETVLSKNALLDAVWPKQSVAEGVLTRAIHELRLVLQDDANQPTYIETVPRRGYRLICPPEQLQTAGLVKNKLRSAFVTAVIVLATVFISMAFLDNSPPVRSVAVLPFANLTGEPENDYVGDGLAESVIHSIAQQSGLRVTARTSSFALRDEDLTAEEVGRRLGVDAIVEGSVREERGVQRITIQLIDSRTGFHDSSVTLDIVNGDLFSAQQRIGQAVETMLTNAGASIETDQHAAPQTVGASYDLFLKGRAALHNRSADSLKNARAYFEEALRIDAEFAGAHAGLAQFYLVSRTYLQMDHERSSALALRSSELALELDPGNTDALMVAAAVAADAGDYRTSVAKFAHAIDLEPSNAQAHQWYGEALAMLGYLTAARESIDKALQLNPLAGSTNSVRAKAAVFFPNDDKLLVTANQGSALGAMLASRELAVHYFRVGNVDAFRREISRYHAVVGVDSGAAELLTAKMSGDISATDLMNQLAPLGTPNDNFFSRELAFLGMHEEALDGIIRGSAAGGGFLSDIWIPEFSGARAVPEFLTFVQTIGLDKYWAQHGLPDVCAADRPEPFCENLSAD